MEKQLSKMNVIWQLAFFFQKIVNMIELVFKYYIGTLIQANLLIFVYHLDKLKTYSKKYLVFIT